MSDLNDQRGKPVHEILLERSGLSERDVMEGKIDITFELIATMLTKIHQGKSVLYGDYIKTHADDNYKLGFTQHYCDIKRKWVRYDNFIRLLSDDKYPDRLELVDTLADMAVYAIIGLQLIDHYNEPEIRAARLKEFEDKQVHFEQEHDETKTGDNDDSV